MAIPPLPVSPAAAAQAYRTVDSGGGLSAASGADFGGVLSRIAVNKQLGGEIERTWKPQGLSIRLVVPRARLTE